MGDAERPGGEFPLPERVLSVPDPSCRGDGIEVLRRMCRWIVDEGDPSSDESYDPKGM